MGSLEPQARKALGEALLGGRCALLPGRGWYLRPRELLGAGPAPSSLICVLPDSAVVLEEGSPSETDLPGEPTELEDFEATLGPERRCRRPEAYSRVSTRRGRALWEEGRGLRSRLRGSGWLAVNSHEVFLPLLLSKNRLAVLPSSFCVDGPGLPGGPRRASG